MSQQQNHIFLKQNDWKMKLKCHQNEAEITQFQNQKSFFDWMTKNQIVKSMKIDEKHFSKQLKRWCFFHENVWKFYE